MNNIKKLTKREFRKTFPVLANFCKEISPGVFDYEVYGGTNWSEILTTQTGMLGYARRQINSVPGYELKIIKTGQRNKRKQMLDEFTPSGRIAVNVFIIFSIFKIKFNR